MKAPRIVNKRIGYAWIVRPISRLWFGSSITVLLLTKGNIDSIHYLWPTCFYGFLILSPLGLFAWGLATAGTMTSD